MPKSRHFVTPKNPGLDRFHCFHRNPGIGQEKFSSHHHLWLDRPVQDIIITVIGR